MVRDEAGEWRNKESVGAEILEPEFGSSEPCKKPSTAMNDCNPSTGQTEVDRAG